MVNFGDSLTDEGRLSYFAGNNGQAPPIGWVPSDWFVNNTASGGRTWPAFVSQGTGVKVDIPFSAEFKYTFR